MKNKKCLKPPTRKRTHGGFNSDIHFFQESPSITSIKPTCGFSNCLKGVLFGARFKQMESRALGVARTDPLHRIWDQG
jgi:hypothetical protein